MNRDRGWDIVLALVLVAIGAAGWTNPDKAPLWGVLAIIAVVLLVLHSQRARFSRGLVRLGVRLGGEEAPKRYIPGPPAAPDPAASIIREEQRAAARGVREYLTSAMTSAAYDRDHGDKDERKAAIESANKAASLATELDDEGARRLVRRWKALFDAIRKGWKEGVFRENEYEQWYEAEPPGYPEKEWQDLEDAAQEAQDSLGALVRLP